MGNGVWQCSLCGATWGRDSRPAHLLDCPNWRPGASISNLAWDRFAAAGPMGTSVRRDPSPSSGVDPAARGASGLDRVPEGERYEIYARREVIDGALHKMRNIHVASTSRDGIGLALVTLTDERQLFPGERIGIFDQWGGRWLVAP